MKRVIGRERREIKVRGGEGEADDYVDVKESF